MEENQDNQENVVTLVDEDGNEEEFVVLDVVEIHDVQYALLAPAGSEEEEEVEVLIMRLENEELVPIEDDAEIAHVIEHLEGHAHH